MGEPAWSGRRDVEFAVDVRPCTPDRWPDVERVFAGPGDPGRCRCQWFYRGRRPARGAGGPEVWAVTCFVVRRPAHRRGLSAALLDGKLYHGALQVFLRAGFAEVGRPAPARPVVRRMLDPAA